MAFKGVSIFFRNKQLHEIMDWNIDASIKREYFYQILLKLVAVVSRNDLKLIIENPWNDSGETYLQCNFLKPTIIDKNRSLRGDYFVKPTAYWFFNCTATNGCSLQPNKDVQIVYKTKDKQASKKGQCSAARSLIHPNYARNFICDFIIGKEQPNITQLDLFENETN
jgi:hypothetical protein